MAIFSPIQTWRIDFIRDALTYEKMFQLLNRPDDFNDEAQTIEVYNLLPSLRVLRVLDRLIHERSTPSIICVDKCPELISYILQQWCDEHKITLQYIQTGSPMKNIYI